MAEYFDADDMGALGAEGRTDFLGEGEHLVKIAEVVWGKSKKNKKDDVLKLILDVVGSSNPAIPRDCRRKVEQSNKGDFGQSFLMQTVKQLAAACNKMPVAHPKLNAPAGTPEAKAAGKAINATFAKLVAGDFNGTQLKITSSVARNKDTGAVAYAKDGSPYCNHIYEFVPQGWAPAVLPTSAFVPHRNGAQAPAPDRARTAASAWEPPGAVADDSADMADGADFWNS